MSVHVLHIIFVCSFFLSSGTFVVAKTSLYYSMPAQIILQTISILRRYGLSGFAGLLLRKDFMESVETLKRISGVDKSVIMSLHELTACIYYKLAIDRGLRGCNPDSELVAHAPRSFARDETRAEASSAAAARTDESSSSNNINSNGQKKSGKMVPEESTSHKRRHGRPRRAEMDPESRDFSCKPAQDADLDTAIRCVV